MVNQVPLLTECSEPITTDECLPQPSDLLVCGIGFPRDFGNGGLSVVIWFLALAKIAGSDLRQVFLGGFDYIFDHNCLLFDLVLQDFSGGFGPPNLPKL